MSCRRCCCCCCSCCCCCCCCCCRKHALIPPADDPSPHFVLLVKHLRKKKKKNHELHITRVGANNHRKKHPRPASHSGSDHTPPTYLHPTRTLKDVCKLLEACEERVRGVMKDCGLLAVSGTTETFPAGSAAGSVQAAEHAFYHSGINSALVPAGSEPVTEGPGEFGSAGC